MVSVRQTHLEPDCVAVNISVSVTAKFDEVTKRPGSTKPMAVLDEINQRGFGRVFSSAGHE